MEQKEIFLYGEGNNYFNRNKNVLSETNVGSGYKFFDKYIRKEYKILEIGCANGHNLKYYNDTIGCECYGIDPSLEAVESGTNIYKKDIKLSVGTSDSIPFDDEYFDFVVFGFCLYLVDRKLLYKSIAEADRVLKNKGYVGIIDFDPVYPKKRPYKYYNGILSYKCNYDKFFLASPHYSLVDKFSYSHSSDYFAEDPSERVNSIILYKDIEQGYCLEEDK